MPLGVYLAFAREMGALGLWLGLAGGLALAAALLSLRLAKHLRADQ
jgi:Na+-driven multidrug efflux pump